MKLPSSLRPKKRYVCFALNCDEKVTKNEVIRALWREILNFLGEQGTSKLNFWLMDFDEEQERGFFRVAHDRVGELKGCLALVSEVDGKRVSFDVLGVSGTVDALKKKFFVDMEVVREDREIELQGKKMRAVQGFDDCVDALPEDRELLARLRRERLTYVGLMKEDLKSPW